MSTHGASLSKLGVARLGDLILSCKMNKDEVLDIRILFWVWCFLDYEVVLILNGFSILYPSPRRKASRKYLEALRKICPRSHSPKWNIPMVTGTICLLISWPFEQMKNDLLPIHFKLNSNFNSVVKLLNQMEDGMCKVELFGAIRNFTASDKKIFYYIWFSCLIIIYEVKVICEEREFFRKSAWISDNWELIWAGNI